MLELFPRRFRFTSRMKRLPLSLTIAAVAGLLWVNVTPSYACSCAIRPVAESVGFYDAVVIGTVLRLTDDPDASFPDKDAVVSVERYLKGSGPQEIVADDPVGDADCGFFGEASVGERYVLFLSDEDLFGDGDDGLLHTHLCAGNQLASDDFLAEVEAVTGPGVAPDGAATSPDPDPMPNETEPLSETEGSGFPYVPVAAGTVGTLAVLLGAAFAWRRRRGQA